MKKLLAFALVATLGISAQAQNKNAKHDLHVKGNCGQCKDRIEKAAYGVKGVKSAEWDSNTQNLHIILNEKKSKVYLLVVRMTVKVQLEKLIHIVIKIKLLNKKGISN